MQGTITAIDEQKRRKGRVNVCLDGKYAFSLQAGLAARLRPGSFLSQEEAEGLLRQDHLARVYRKALDLLAYRPRSRAEMKRYLSRKGVNAEIREEVLERLTQGGLLDDLAFARYWVENRERFRPRGLAMLRSELRSKGVEDEVISQVLAEVNEVESARQMLSRQAAKYAHLEDKAFREKMTNFLRRRGFPYPVIREVVGLHLEERAQRDLPSTPERR